MNLTDAGMVHLGNTTNNRVEDAHRRIKLCTHQQQPLIKSIQQVWKFLDRSIRDYQMQSITGCHRHIVNGKDDYVTGILIRLTTYAGKLIRNHLRNRSIELDFTELRNFQVCCFLLHDLSVPRQ